MFELGHVDDVVEGRPVLLAGEPAAFHAEALATCRGKRLRASFFNVAARVVRSSRRVYLRLPRAYRFAEAFIAALAKLRALPTFA